jgi:hypothetical protein
MLTAGFIAGQYVNIDGLGDARIAVAQPFLPHLKRTSERLHHGRRGMFESVKAVGTGNCDSWFLDQRFELGLSVLDIVNTL